MNVRIKDTKKVENLMYRFTLVKGDIERRYRIMNERIIWGIKNPSKYKKWLAELLKDIVKNF